MLLPLRKIRSGDDIRSGDINAVIDRVNAITPRSGKNVRVVHLGNGVTQDVDVPRQSASGSARGLSPFQVYVAGGSGDTAWQTCRVHTGSIIVPTDAEKIFEPTNDDAAGSPLTFTVPESTDLYKVWLALTISVSGGKATVNSSNAVLASGAAGWSGYSNTLSSTKWFFLLAEINTSADTDKQIQIQQYVTSFIQLPFFIPDPSTSPNPDTNGCIHVLLVQ
jgi:hypothetical protein